MLPESAVLLLHEDDNVCVAIQPLSKGDTFTGSIGRIVVVEPVRLGHKIAQRDIAKGESVLKYGQIIGVALERIEARAWVHCHNVGMNDVDRDYELTTVVPAPPARLEGGSTALVDVYQYAEPVTTKGFVVMDTPGFDPPSVTGMVAGGANVVVFTTGRGSCFGCKPTPSIKVASNTAFFERMPDDMDVNAGVILDENRSVDEVGQALFQGILDVASGKKTKSEELGLGDEEFVP